MKTTAWALSAEKNNAPSELDDMVIFSASDTREETSCPLLAALLAGTTYASLSRPFKIFSITREELVRYAVGAPAEGRIELCQALGEIAVHLKAQVTAAVEAQAEAVGKYAQTIFDESLAIARVELRAELETEIRAQLEAEYAVRALDEKQAGTSGPDSPGVDSGNL